MGDRHDHDHHHKHHRRHSSSSSDEDHPPPHPDFHQPPPYDRPPPPPYDQPPPPPFYGNQPPPPPYGYDNQPPPPYHPPEHEEERHGYRPHMPEFIESRIHGSSHHSESGGGSSDGGDLKLNRMPSVRVYTKADPNFVLAVRNGTVILAKPDSSDPTQQWAKDERYSTKVKDQDGYPSYALVNKGTSQALKHSIGATHPVQLVAYNPAVVDESVLWTSGKDLGNEYRQIRMVNNTRLVFDAFNGDKNHGGVHDGTTVVLWEPGKGDNQRWQITPY